MCVCERVLLKHTTMLVRGGVLAAVRLAGRSRSAALVARLHTEASPEWQRLLDAAERRDDTDAMARVGAALLHAKGGAPQADVRTGKAWLREAAERGHVGAQATLGRVVYEEMEHLRRQSHAHDYQASAEAERWLKCASDQGDVPSARYLVPLYVARGDLLSACRMFVTWICRRSMRW